MSDVNPPLALERGMERLTRFRVFNKEPDFFQRSRELLERKRPGQVLNLYLSFGCRDIFLFNIPHRDAHRRQG
jgi:hypothetical protein